MTGNPLLFETWDTPFGAPPFDRIEDAHFRPAFEAGIERHRAEIEAIAGGPGEGSFEDTIFALERSGQLLLRTEAVFEHLASADSNEARRKLRSEMAPRLAAHRTWVWTHPALWRRVQAVHAQAERAPLEGEAARLLEHVHRRFVRGGAQLEGEKKGRFDAIVARLAELYTAFDEQIRAANTDYALFVKDETQLAGLSAALVATAAKEAETRGRPGEWAFTLMRSSFEPFMESAKQRDLRRSLYRAYFARGHIGPHDTRPLILEIVQLRAERAELLGFESHAHYAIADGMAKTPEAVEALMSKLWNAARKKATAERVELEAELRADLGEQAKLEPWDWAYYAARVAKAKYGLDPEAMAPYFSLDAVRAGAFDAAGRLFGLRFEEISDRAPRYRDDVRVYAVRHGEDDAPVGWFYCDDHARAGKQSGAWMDELRRQSKLDGEVKPIVLNVASYAPPAGDQPTLLSWAEVRTLFHEMGHGLHGLLSNITYPSLSGTRVKRDYVELPSQLFENWGRSAAHLATYAKHHQTGEPLPEAWVETLKAAERWNQGFQITELLAATFLDLCWHGMSHAQAMSLEDVDAFEAFTLNEIGLMPEIAPRYRSTHFLHIWSGEAYSAGYYVYLWAEVLEADVFGAFAERGDLFDPELARRLRDEILSVGGARDEMAQFEAFRGRPPEVGPLLVKKGLAAE